MENLNFYKRIKTGSKLPTNEKLNNKYIHFLIELYECVTYSNNTVVTKQLYYSNTLNLICMRVFVYALWFK